MQKYEIIILKIKEKIIFFEMRKGMGKVFSFYFKYIHKNVTVRNPLDKRYIELLKITENVNVKSHSHLIYIPLESIIAPNEDLQELPLHLVKSHLLNINQNIPVNIKYLQTDKEKRCTYFRKVEELS